MFSVLINTYNRATKLATTLRAVESQDTDCEEFETIVVDDGSTDSTHTFLKKWRIESEKRLTVRHPSNRGPSAARNSAIRAASGDTLIFLGDDTVPKEGFLKSHIAFQRGAESAKQVAVGYTCWAKHLHQTPFLTYINEFGPQFGYELLRRGMTMDWRFVYTSNLSIRRSFIDALPDLFDEDFTTAALEDIDLGYRLHQAGATFVFLDNAVASHDHPTDLITFCRRQRSVGSALPQLLSKHPELKPRYTPRLHHRLAATAWSAMRTPPLQVLNWWDGRLRLPLPRFVYQAVCGLAMVQGFKNSQNSLYSKEARGELLS